MNRWLISFLMAATFFGLFFVQSNRAQEMREDKGMSLNKSSLVGTWVSYMSESEWGPVMGVYDFYNNRKYRIIISLIPEKTSPQTVAVGISMTGTYVVSDNTLVLKPSTGSEATYKCEIDDESLYLLGEGDVVTILQKVMNYGVTK